MGFSNRELESDKRGFGPDPSLAMLKEHAARLESRHHELRHRIKNDLQKLLSLLHFQAKKTGSDTCKECMARVNSIAQLHTILDEENSDIPPLASYLQSIADAAQRAFGDSFTIETAFEPQVVLNAERAALLGLILNEAIMNAIKHAFENRRNGMIAAVLHREGQVLELSVRDNGNGFEVAAVKAQRGMRLMSALSEQLNGELTWMSSQEGTLVRLLFPA